MHPKGGGFAAFRARTQRVLRHAGHGIDHRITQLQQFLFLFAGERVQSALAMVAAQ